MSNFYLDIETTGLDPETDDIISIQYQELDRYSNPTKPLVILKSWETSEKEIVTRFHKTLLEGQTEWEFVPVLTNHIFDFRFLFNKFKKYELESPELEEYLYKKPFIDIKYTLIIANGLSFRGSSLEQMSNKTTSGNNIPEYYKNKEYEKIIEYIKMESESFIEILKKCQAILPAIKRL